MKGQFLATCNLLLLLWGDSSPLSTPYLPKSKVACAVIFYFSGGCRYKPAEQWGQLLLMVFHCHNQFFPSSGRMSFGLLWVLESNVFSSTSSSLLHQVAEHGVVSPSWLTFHSPQVAFVHPSYTGNSPRTPKSWYRWSAPPQMKIPGLQSFIFNLDTSVSPRVSLADWISIYSPHPHFWNIISRN